MSDAQMNGTLVVFDGTGVETRYNVGIRNRGGSSRVGPPNNYHVSIPKDNLWLDRADITINAYFPHSQVLGSAVFQDAGQPSADSLVIQVRVNNTNLAETGNRMFGRYVRRGNERLSGEVAVQAIAEVVGESAREFHQVVRHLRTEEGHHPRLIAIQFVIPARDDVADVISIEAGDADSDLPRAEGILELNGQLAAEIAWCANPNSIVQA